MTDGLGAYRVDQAVGDLRATHHAPDQDPAKSSLAANPRQYSAGPSAIGHGVHQFLFAPKPPKLFLGTFEHDGDVS